MRDHVHIDPACHRKRWVAHLDLLGTGRLVETKAWTEVFGVYSRAIERFRKDAFDEHLIERSIFSDSFVLWAVDDTARSYRAIDSFCRHFVAEMIQQSLPIRGAMAFGEFYADKVASLYFGKALVDAYKLSESQNWIGFVLSESVCEQLSALNLPAQERLNYALWNVPLKLDKSRESSIQELPAFIIGHSPARTSVDPIIRILKSLQLRVQARSVQQMYENAVHFLEKNIRNVTA